MPARYATSSICHSDRRELQQTLRSASPSGSSLLGGEAFLASGDNLGEKCLEFLVVLELDQLATLNRS